MAAAAAAEQAAAPPALLRQLVARAFGSPDAAVAPRPGEATTGERAWTPPRADAPPKALPPDRAPPGFAEMPPQELREALLAATDGALDRLKLAQYASLPREATAPAQAAQPGSQHVQPPQAWVMEVPALIGREASLAQFRVTRDGRSGAPEAEGPSWSIDVALDTSATGPIHARLRLGGGRLGVTLWAERSETAQQLRQDMPALRRTLDEAAFSVEDVTVLDGAPAAPPKGGVSAGALLDTAHERRADPRKVAVALEYDRMGAPRVTAKGRGALAERILDVARENDVPIEDDALLAEALSRVPLDDEIPVELYRAVAAVIGFILATQRQRPSGG